ncbi:hypothetical protein [Olleya sp. Bg11-27]|uniref:hypothetical protein n=1 Tax=Olleya sp. Bg11-27 TaxID=2058135 RepID=UPI000C30E197|nr:hypothetical protein [Olleya sp. Bg11-27]AUC76960.1 hypothetical protein CW732_15255 [Olleya sp. Bg11-27]
MKKLLISPPICALLLINCKAKEPESVLTAQIACKCAHEVEDIESKRECIKNAIIKNKDNLEIEYKDENIPVINENGELTSFYF